MKAGQSLGDLITTVGRETDVDLIITGEFDALNSVAAGLRDPDANLLEDLAIETATRDTFARGSLSSSLGVPNAGFMLTGLDSDAAYDFRFFGSLRSNRDRVARYSVLGAGDPVVKDLMLARADEGQNTSRTADFSGIQPDRFGQIFIDLQPINGKHDGYVGIMELTVASRVLPGDFDGDETLSTSDIDLLAAAIRDRSTVSQFDINGDSIVSQDDNQHWVHEIKGTWFGDANLDGEFDSGDLVQVFQTEEYEDDIVMNSGWSDGDFNGDGEFDTGDLVFAFQDGGYEQGSRAAVAAVPKPTNLLITASWIALIGFCRHRTSH